MAAKETGKHRLPLSLFANKSFPWLVCLVLCGASGVSARLQNATLPATPPGQVYTVCTGPNDPYVDCTVGLNPSDAAGYSIEVFKRVALQVGLASAQYTFVCLNYSALLADMTDPAGICDMTAAGVTFISSRLKQGIKFVYPEDYRTGLVVMVHADLKSGGQWLFLKPFKWEVWLLLLCAAIAVGLSVHAVEVISKRHMRREVLARFRFNGEGGIADTMWAAIAQVASAGDPLSAVSLPSRLIIFVWCFLILLLLTIYTGNAAAILTTTSINSDIQSVNDLRGRNWGTGVQSVSILASQGLVPTAQFPLNNAAEQATMLAALRSGDVNALVLECGFVQWITSYQCDLQLIGDCFSPQDQGTTFWQNASDASVALAGVAVLTLEEGGDLDMLRNAFINPTSSSCGSSVSNTQSVSFAQVSGLWIVLAVTIGIAFVGALVLHHINKRKYLAYLRDRAVARKRRRRSSNGSLGPTDPGAASPAGNLEKAEIDLESSQSAPADL